MIAEFITRKKKWIAAFLGFYFLFFGGLMLYVSKMTVNSTPLETLIHFVETRLK